MAEAARAVDAVLLVMVQGRTEARALRVDSWLRRAGRMPCPRAVMVAMVPFRAPKPATAGTVVSRPRDAVAVVVAVDPSDGFVS